MRLISLSLQNFRQHAASFIGFGPGLTGIIGANGSGKSTILEGIAFALYGQPAARGKKESIKSLRAQPRATVRVELVVELAGHEYRIVRGLTSAEVYIDRAATPIANTLTGATEQIQKVLGMSREEFFCTYFTGQKELAAMASMMPTERGKFLSRVLGYDRLAEAQESARKRRSTLVAELTGLRSGMQDGDALAQQARDAADRLATANDAVAKWHLERSHAREGVALVVPEWADAQARQAVTNALTLDRGTAASRVIMYQRDVERLTAAIVEIDRVWLEAAPLREAVIELPALREALRGMDAQADAQATRQNLLGVQATMTATLERATERLALLRPVDDAGIAAELAQRKADVAAAEARAEAARDEWTEKASEARAALESLRSQFEAVAKQQGVLATMGEDSPCGSCGQRIGARLADVMQEVTDRVEQLKQAGVAARAKCDELKTTPASVTVAQALRSEALAALQAVEQVAAQAKATQDERARLTADRDFAAGRLEAVSAELAALSVTYDAEAHQQTRRRVDDLSGVAARLFAIDAQLAGVEKLRGELEQAVFECGKARFEEADAAQRLAIEGIAAEAYDAARLAHERAVQRETTADHALVNALAEQTRAEEALGHHRAAQERFAFMRERVANMEHERLVLDETDRGYTDLRATLNASVRPELAEIASELLDTLTDGRYTQADIDENYTLVVMQDGVAKPVLSGGEEDLCNLILRLAISQMIAQRAGHVFSLLILDEVFGALDDARRANVVDLLRRLNDRFAQVIVITHINQVRDGLDNVLQVRYDAESGSSVIVADDVSAGVLLQEAA